MQLSVTSCMRYSGSYSGLVPVVKADENPHMKEYGPQCGHVLAVAEHPSPGHCTYEAMLVCLDLGIALVG